MTLRSLAPEASASAIPPLAPHLGTVIIFARLPGLAVPAKHGSPVSSRENRSSSVFLWT